MAAVEGEADRGLDVEDILSRTERRPLTFSRRRVLYQAPEFVKRLNGDDNANEGATVHFECKVKGFPKPALTWYKDDQQMELNSRFKVESLEGGIHIVTIDNVKRSDEATYRCRAENVEGITSSTFYLSVKGKSSSRSSKRKKSQSPNRRLVSFPLLFPTIVEKVDEEEKEEEVAKKQPPSPLTQLYDGTTMQTRHTWPKFVGDWAFVEDGDERFCAGDEWQTKNGSLERVTFTDGATEDDVFLEDNQASGAAIIRETPPPLIKPMEIPPVLSSTLNGINVSEQKICRNITAASQGLIVRSDISGNDSGPSSNVRERELAENSKNLIKSQKPISNETITTNVAPLQPSTTQIGPFVAFPRSLRTNRHGEGNKHGLRNQASRGSESPVSDLLAAILLLSAFTFCALCVPIVPEIFVVIVFVVSLFFQILMDLNAQ